MRDTSPIIGPLMGEVSLETYPTYTYLFYLSFKKTMTLNCSSFVYYSWKNLFLQNILKCPERYTSSLKYRQMAKNHYSMILRKSINMLISVLRKFYKHLCWRTSVSKNICERLLLNMCLWDWEKLTFKALCYFQSEKIWVAVMQN